MKKTFQLSIIATALVASSAYAAPVWEGPTGTGSGFSNSMGGETNYNNVDPSANGVLIGQLNDVANTSVGIGYDSQATGEKSYASGSLNNWEGTTGGGDSTISIGRSTYAKGDNSIAVGASVQADEANGIAVGNSQRVHDENATAVGGHSVVHGNQSSSFGDFAGTSADGATAIGSQTWSNATNATTLGYNAETSGENALNIGHDAHGGGLDAIHIGHNTTGSAENTIVIGSNDPTKAGQPWADDKNSVAIGYNADTHNGGGGSTEDTVSFGGFFTGAVRTISQVADGINDHDAINVSQLNDAIAGLTSGAELIAHADAQLTTEKNQRIAADTDLQAAIDNEAQLRAAADADQTAARTAAIDNEAQLRAAADETEKAARILGDQALAEARIAGDAAEAAARTAAINAEAQARIAGDAAEAQARADADLALSQRIDLEAATRTAEVKRLDGRIDHASRRLDDIEKTAYRGVAIALAAQQAVPNIRSGQVALFAGVGHFEGETAGSVGVVTSFISNRVSLSGAVGFAGGNEVGGRVGLSYAF
ncbi:adhesin [Acinetobacter sp. 2JN-4]|uniref:YadA-like family protein n=1 Tax=Acinetobacter sp. 2JN-4 TaxID=2479844 RepID=UPI000EFA0A3F|nr:YadA-like family protein [Acinetobacter sp. 2JN-4]RLZ07226.1 adhesin [Acinetobacter sp. 2JN-4]